MKNFLRNKKILVTGATGFIGTNLVEKLVSLGANVTGTIFKNNPQIEIPNVNYINVDLTKEDCCNIVCKNQDYIFMTSANSSGAETIEKQPLSHLTPNVIMNSLMLKSAYESNVKKFCFISSNTVYPVTDYPVSENDVNYTFFDKYHIVGWMKLFSEKMCEMYSSKINNPMETIVIRPGNLYGPFDKYTTKESKVIAALIRRFAERQNPIEVWGDGNDIKDFLYIDDFINGLLKSFTINNLNNPVNIASSVPSTIKDVINCLKIISNSKDVNIYLIAPNQQ